MKHPDLEVKNECWCGFCDFSGGRRFT